MKLEKKSIGKIVRFGFLVALIIAGSGCSVIKKQSSTENKKAVDLKTFCLEAKKDSTLLIDDVRAEIDWEDEVYRAEINIYYIKDSALYFNAQKAGFEIIRGVITEDSMMLINRMDKRVYTHYTANIERPVPIDFQEVKLLVDKNELCGESNIFTDKDHSIRIDHSQKGIRSYINYKRAGLMLQRFEFYNTNTDEYFVGERTGPSSFTMYANYVVQDMVIRTEGGRVRKDKEVLFSMSYNKSKYQRITL